MWPLENEKALEYRLTFASKPQNTFVFDVLCSQGLSWNYQAPLTANEVEKGFERPDNVVDSYAIYCNKKDNQYRAGKFCHIYRWQLTDAEGNQAWANQKVEFNLLSIAKNRVGTLTITLPALLGVGVVDGVELGVEDGWKQQSILCS